MSESDYPLTVTQLGALPDLDEKSLLAALGQPETSLVTRQPLEELFGRAAQDQAWHGPEEHATVERYRALLSFLSTALQGARVFRIGEIEVAAYALGKTSDGKWLGVATTLIET